MEQSDSLILEVTNVSKAFPGVQALDRVSLQIRRGEVHALIGENGAGKSTLVNIIFGVQPADSGRIRFNAQDANFASPAEAIHAGLSLISQELSLFPNLTVAENIAIDRLPARAGRTVLDRSKMLADAERLHAEVGIVIDPRVVLGDLNLGQQQLVEIARAWSMKSKLVIMDEPTSSLSSAETEKLFEIIARLKARNATVIYISHRLDEVFRVADRVTVLRDGHVIRTLATAAATKDELISLMVGRRMAQMFAARKESGGDEILRIEGLGRKGYFKDLNLSLQAGEIVGLYGLVGAGRTEFALSLFGVDPSDEGRIYAKGQPVSIRSPMDALRHGIMYLSEDRKAQSIIPTGSVKENITLSNLHAYAPRVFIRRRAEEQAATGYVTQLQIRTPSIHKLVMELSGGNQQKVVLSRLLEKHPAVMILDEPTRGIDVGAKAEVHRIVEELAESGMSILLISSDMPEILGMADRIVTMKRGRITGSFNRGQADQDEILRAAS